MEETQHQWVTATAERAHFAVPFFIGAGAGAFGAVLVGAVDASGVPLNVYLGLAAALIGILSAWTLAFWSDRIKRRRKAHVVRLQAEALLSPLLALRDLIAMPRFGDLIAASDHRTVWVSIGTITLVHEAAVRPTFDELIDTRRDYEILAAAQKAFDFCRRRFTAPTAAELNDQKSRDRYLWSQVMVPDTLPAMDKAIGALRAAELHLKGW